MCAHARSSVCVRMRAGRVSVCVCVSVVVCVCARARQCVRACVRARAQMLKAEKQTLTPDIDSASKENSSFVYNGKPHYSP